MMGKLESFLQNLSHLDLAISIVASIIGILLGEFSQKRLSHRSAAAANRAAHENADKLAKKAREQFMLTLITKDGERLNVDPNEPLTSDQIKRLNG